MTHFYKLLSNTIALSTANTIFNAKVVRIVNPSTSPVLVTQANSTSNIASAVILANNEIVILKNPSETLIANATVNAVSVGYF